MVISHPNDCFSISQARQILERVFGYRNFRDGQEKVIEKVLKGTDTLAIMPTGKGKSLCFQIPALLFDGLSIVISPLIALMKDQVDALKTINYPVRALNNQTSTNELLDIEGEIRSKHLKLLYISPERLENQRFRAMLDSAKLSMVAIDEAHCISEWGHDFRPQYRKIIDHLTPFFKDNTPIKLALTATATPEVVGDIQTALKLNDPFIYIGGFDRKNLSFSAFNVENKRRKLYEILQAVGGSSIVYTSSRTRAEELERYLNHNFIKAKAYHAGLDDSVRTGIQTDYFQNRFRVICATNAFGMGINKTDIRTVIHYDVPDNLEAYYQEAGRAGRDGKRSYAVLLYNISDMQRQDYIIESLHPGKDELILGYERIKSYQNGNAAELNLSKQALLESYNRKSSKPITAFKLQAILNTLAREGLLSITKTLDKKQVVLKALVERFVLKEWVGSSGDQNQKALFEGLLRTYGEGCFNRYVAFNHEAFGKKNNIERQTLESLLNDWSQNHLIDLKDSDEIHVLLNGAYHPKKKLPIDWRKLDRRKRLAQKKFKQMKSYAFYTRCRRNYILDYFGESRYNEKCKICDNCTGRHKRS